MDVTYAILPWGCAIRLSPDLVIIAIAAAASASHRRAHPGTSNSRNASGSMDGHTRVVLWRDGIPLVAQAYFAAARDTLNATRMGNRCAIMAERSDA